MINIYLYTRNIDIFESESETIKNFFSKYNIECNINFTSDYKEITSEIRKIDIVFVYEDVWENAYTIIESQTEESDNSNKEVYIIKSDFPIDVEKLEKNKNKLIPNDKVICLKSKNEILRIKSKRIL